VASSSLRNHRGSLRVFEPVRHGQGHDPGTFLTLTIMATWQKCPATQWPNIHQEAARNPSFPSPPANPERFMLCADEGCAIEVIQAGGSPCTARSFLQPSYSSSWR
jgi:hypothetical protein